MIVAQSDESHDTTLAEESAAGSAVPPGLGWRWWNSPATGVAGYRSAVPPGRTERSSIRNEPSGHFPPDWTNSSSVSSNSSMAFSREWHPLGCRHVNHSSSACFL